MKNTMILTRLKASLPRFIRSPLGKLRAVVRRLLIWYAVATRISGVSHEDKKILGRAIWHVPLTVWKNLDKWQFPMVDADCTVQSKNAGQFRVRARTDDLFHVLPGQEPAVEATIRALLRPGDVFVDAGSNIGYYTIVAATLVGATGRVIACEMMPITAKILRDHVDMNNSRNVTVVEAALSDTVGQHLQASYPDGRHGQASIARDFGGCAISVETTTLNTVLRDTLRVRLIKMDIEGAELGALKGLGDALEKIEAIIFENRDGPAVAQWLEDRNFFVSAIDGNNAIAHRRISAN